MSCDYALAIRQRSLQAGKTGTLTPLTTTALLEGPECHRPALPRSASTWRRAPRLSGMHSKFVCPMSFYRSQPSVSPFTNGELTDDSERF
jgi:hypothetical protein